MTDKVNKEVSLIGRDFGDFRKNLIDFAKNYFPETYNDFNESSPGMMFMEMASYVGDVLSYYTDVQLRESILEQAQEKGNVFLVAQSMGYAPKLNVPATTVLTIYQIVPAQGSATLSVSAVVGVIEDGKARIDITTSFEGNNVLGKAQAWVKP